jgi:transposase
MERFTNTFTIPQHLLAAIEGVDRVGRLPGRLEKAAETSRSAETAGLGGGVCRRDVQSRKKGGPDVGKTKRGKGTKIMLLVDGHGTPLGADISSASPAEVKLVERLLDKRVLRRSPDHLIYDRAADSDPLRARLAARRIWLVCPHRYNRIKPRTQDGRRFRRYRRRWKVERTISWLFNFRRLVVRYERHSHLFLGLVHLACVYSILKRF